MISGFHRDLNDICTLLESYATHSGISLPTSSYSRRLVEPWGRDRQFVPKCR